MATMNQHKEIEITDDTALGLGMLMAEFGDGKYRPIGVVSTVGEAREIAQEDMRLRKGSLKEAPQPQSYAVWARRVQGSYREVTRFDGKAVT
jgi:hypothetical protein